jgi:CRISPR-associated endonuclease Csn1
MEKGGIFMVIKDYRLGLDIGTNSVGWGIIELEWNDVLQIYEKKRILDKGVRMFDRAEVPKTGASLALPRRLARSSRRRLGRKSSRKQKIRKLIVSHGLLNQEQLDRLYPLAPGSVDVWDLRIESLDRLLSGKELARLLIHLAQRRGYKSNRKTEEKETETGVVLKSIQQNHERLKNYRTVGEMWIKDEEFLKYERKRNSTDSYLFSVSRSQLEEEIKYIFNAQRSFGSVFASEELEKAYLRIWNHQLPFAVGDDILKKVGNCSIFPEEKRIPKASYTFQYFVALDALNRVRLGINHRPLTDTERFKVLDHLFNRDDYFNKSKVPDVKYSDIRKWLNLKEDELFKGLIYDPDQTLNENEKCLFVKLHDYYSLHKILKTHSSISGEQYEIEDYDLISYALTIYKTDEDIREFLQNGKNPLNKFYSCDLVENLLFLSFSKFGHLSKKAIQHLLSKMLEGLTFKESADAMEVDTTGLAKTVKQHLLPQIPDDLTNPIVKRALSQSRKVLNAVIKKYGSPHSIHIELARDLSRDFEERRTVQKDQKANRERNQGAVNFLVENGILHPTGYDITRYKLWKEQNQKCAYSLEEISPDIFINELKRERNSVPTLEVDHIVPYSISFMDGYHNKVLVYSDENRKKGNRLPYEYLSTIPGRWEKFQNFVQTTYPQGKRNSFKAKRELLLKKEISEEAIKDLSERHLNDTRFITRYFKNFIEKNLKFSDSLDNRKKRVVAVSGQITSFVRKRWGLEKVRENTYLHHAMDAIVVACTDDIMIKRITDYMKNKEDSFKRFKVFFPQPWEGFREEIVQILNKQPIPEEIITKIKNGLSERDYVLVSRMPRYSVTGEAHEETIRKKAGIDKNGKILTSKRIHLRDISFDKNGDFEMVGKESDFATYETIKNHYLAYNGNVQEAFADENLPYKPIKPGKDPSKANRIKKITVIDNAKSYVREVNGGIASNGSLVRVDIFLRKGKYIMVPIYVADTVMKELPKKYVKSGKGYKLWPELDQFCEFQFSLYPYDLLYITNNRYKEILHFVSLNISNNLLKCKPVNTPSENYIEITLGSISQLKKLKTDVLGNIQIVKNEKRRQFLKNSRSKNIQPTR